MIISCTILKKENSKKIFQPSETAFHYEGRFDFQNPTTPTFSFPGVNFSFRFKGSSSCRLLLQTKASNQYDYYMVMLDKQAPFVLKTSNDSLMYDLAKDLDKDTEHQITVFKRTEAFVSKAVFLGIELDSAGELLPWIESKDFQMEFIGNSITCGYGNEGKDQHCKFSAETENNYMAYGAIIARKFNAEYMATAISGYGIMRGYSGDTLNVMPRYYDKVNIDTSTIWKDTTWHPKITVINIGTNDFAKGIPDSLLFTKKYLDFVLHIKKQHPNTKIVCVSGPMMSDTWPPKKLPLTHLNNYLKAIMKEANKQIGKNDVYFFALTTQGKLGYGCDWHPNIRQHEYNAQELYDFLVPIVKQ